MSARYDAAAVEARWQAAWDEAGVFTARHDPSCSPGAHTGSACCPVPHRSLRKGQLRLADEPVRGRLDAGGEFTPVEVGERLARLIDRAHQ